MELVDRSVVNRRHLLRFAVVSAPDELAFSTTHQLKPSKTLWNKPFFCCTLRSLSF